MVKDAAEKEIMFHDELNNHMGQGNFHRQRPFHATIHVTSQEGLKKSLPTCHDVSRQLLFPYTKNSAF